MTLTGLLFMLGFFGGLGLALARHPIYGLYTYLAVFYADPPSRWWGHFLPDLRWSFTAAIVTLIAIWWRLPKIPGRQAWYSTAPAKIMIVFVIWFWILSFWALDLRQHLGAAVLVTKYLAVYYLFYKLADSPGKITGILLAHLAGCLYLGIIAFGADASERLDGVGGPGINDSNTLGMHLATGVAVGAMLTLHLSK